MRVEGQGGKRGCTDPKYCQHGKSNKSGEVKSWSFDTRDVCNFIDCVAAETTTGLIATGLDTFAFGMNLTFMGIVDAAALTDMPLVLGAALGAYRFASPIPNAIGTVGGLFWGAQGILSGSNYVAGGVTFNSDNGTINEVNISGAISQDTIVAGVLDGISWLLPEPNSAAVVSGMGVTYDVLRNPLSPSLSSAPPIISTMINPSLSVSYNFMNNTGSISGSFFSP